MSSAGAHDGRVRYQRSKYFTLRITARFLVPVGQPPSEIRRGFTKFPITGVVLPGGQSFSFCSDSFSSASEGVQPAGSVTGCR